MREKGEVNSGLNFQIIPDFFMEQKKKKVVKKKDGKAALMFKDILSTLDMKNLNAIFVLAS